MGDLILPPKLNRARENRNRQRFLDNLDAWAGQHNIISKKHSVHFIDGFVVFTMVYKDKQITQLHVPVDGLYQSIQWRNSLAYALIKIRAKRFA